MPANTRRRWARYRRSTSEAGTGGAATAVLRMPIMVCADYNPATSSQLNAEGYRPEHEKIDLRPVLRRTHRLFRARRVRAVRHCVRGWYRERQYRCGGARCDGDADEPGHGHRGDQGV